MNEPVLICAELETVPIGIGAYDADVANEEEIALLAQLEVPINVPVNDPLKDPVLIWSELLTVPTGTGAYDAEIALLAQLAVPNVEPL